MQSLEVLGSVFLDNYLLLLGYSFEYIYLDIMRLLNLSKFADCIPEKNALFFVRLFVF